MSVPNALEQHHEGDGEESSASAVALQTAETQLVQALLSGLPRPEPATAGRLGALVCPCVTVKLDGTRTLVVASSRGVHAHTLREVCCLSPVARPSFSALDAEEVSGHYYIFDALFVNSIDVRHLPLRSRLREAARCLPAKCSLKRYYWGDDPSLQVIVQRLVSRKLRLADGSIVHPVEGFIFTSSCSSYHEPPVKFKFLSTCDFLLLAKRTGSVGEDDNGSQSAHHRFDLYIQKNGELERFWGCNGVQATVSLNAEEATLLGIPPGGATLSDNIIAELKLVGAGWVCVRRRRDRERPNTLTTVLENIDIQRSGRSNANFLIKNLVNSKPSPAAWRDRIIDAMLRAVSTTAATVAGPAVGLFLPDAEQLEEELLRDGGADAVTRKAVGIVVPPPAFEAHCRTAFHALALTMDQVVATATRLGWRCKWMKSLQGKDFQNSCEDARFAGNRRTSLDGLQFLLLRNFTGDDSCAPDT